MVLQRLGHAMFRITTPGRRVILVDPWMAGNPTCPADWQGREAWADLDLILITHGHFDHVAGVEQARAAAPRAPIVAGLELAQMLEARGHGPLIPINPGGSLTLSGIEISAVSAAHSSALLCADGAAPLPCGPALGYVLRFEDGQRLYVAGDTGLSADMKVVIGDYFRPEVAILPVDGLVTMTPAQAAYAVKLIGCRHAVPCHDLPPPAEAPQPALLEALLREFPALRGAIGRSQEFAQLLEAAGEAVAIPLAPGAAVQLSDGQLESGAA